MIGDHYYYYYVHCASSGMELRQVDPMIVIKPKGGIALWTLPLACLVAGTNAVVAEDMEALCQHSVFLPRSTAGAVQLALV